MINTASVSKLYAYAMIYNALEISFNGIITYLAINQSINLSIYLSDILPGGMKHNDTVIIHYIDISIYKRFILLISSLGELMKDQMLQYY